jgi:hypothetical protein
MGLATLAGTNWNEVTTESHREPDQRNPILSAISPKNVRLPGVDDKPLSRYYTYLSAEMSFPFAAHYPEPTAAEERVQFRCTVLELFDPAKHLGDEVDGIFCKIRKGKYEINLPLVELHVAPDSANSQLIDDYSHEFWNWR